MDYRPKYAQPFTLTEARLLDVQTIAEEIARLQNSLQHLHDTQTMLKEAMESDPDPELTKALEENRTVICSGSQTERIAILKLALSDKGVIMSEHYDPPKNTGPAATPPAAPEPPENDEDGVEL
ncbi:hypothetical protein HMN09_01224900 [Mycena chlorophos]|uniref:Uncharacterized protein n=1 Tax=Mycena chlorophos TaxID=658473 RepID=A0A8H6S457_MYCCL|nr:hypothetical protein HMN09_01224900 [Mycena chlorophos]